MNLKKLNHYGQELNQITKKISDANAIWELINGNEKPAKRKAKKKIKNAIINKIIK